MPLLICCLVFAVFSKLVMVSSALRGPVVFLVLCVLGGVNESQDLPNVQVS